MEADDTRSTAVLSTIGIGRVTSKVTENFGDAPAVVSVKVIVPIRSAVGFAS